MTAFSREIIAEFIEEPSWTMRAKSIERVAALYVDDELDEAQTRTAFELFRVALYDGEPLVRRILAETLKHAIDLPRDIALALAQDVSDVAAPFLKFSPLLSVDDLAAIARDGTLAHRHAIACRARVILGAQTVMSAPRRMAVGERPVLSLVAATVAAET